MAQDYTRALESFDRDGYVVLENIIEAEQIEELKEALLRVERDEGITGRDTDFEGRQTIRIYNLLAHGEAFWDLEIFEFLRKNRARQGQALGFKSRPPALSRPQPTSTVTPPMNSPRFASSSTSLAMHRSRDDLSWT